MSFSKQDKPMQKRSFNERTITVQKTDISSTQPNKATKIDPAKTCPLHNKPHSLQNCKAFRYKVIEERKAFLKKNGICFKCCASTSHLAKDCKTSVKCQECDTTYHVTAMHPSTPSQAPKAPPTPQDDGGEAETNDTDTPVVSSSCTEVCGERQFGCSCTKICLAKIYPVSNVQKVINAYVIIDDQSNRSLAKPEFFNLYGIQTEPSSYQLRTCSGLAETSGRRAEGFMIESIDGKVAVPLPPLIECSDIPNNRSEIPTASAVLYQSHLRHIAKHIPELDVNAEILLLLGRDILRLHKVRQQINGPHNAPFAQRLDLVWVVIGDVCLGNSHKPVINNFKTTVLEGGRPSNFQPCTSYMQVKESLPKPTCVNKITEETLGKTVFDKTAKDNSPAPSIEDTLFMEKMDNEMYQDSNNTWVAPLPFKEPRPYLSNNKQEAGKGFETEPQNARTVFCIHGQDHSKWTC